MATPTPATMLTTNANRAWLPEEIGQLVIEPVQAYSVAMAVATVPRAMARVDAYRVPIIKADPTASWVAEGEEIPASTSTLAETADVFHKLAGLTVISRELANDSSPDAAQQVGQGLARDIATKVDAAFFGTRADNPVAPKGLTDLTDVNTIKGKLDSTDAFVAAIYDAANVGATISAFVANPADALTLAQLKDEDGSRRPLLGTDPTQPTGRTIAGVPLVTSAAVTAGTVWGIPKDRVLIPLREDVTLTRDESVFFTSDRIAVRATMRMTTLFPHEAAIQKITLGA